MGSTLLFVIIMIFVLYRKFNEIAAENQTNNAPTEDEKSEIERRIQEIIGEPHSEVSTPAPTVRQIINIPKPSAHTTHNTANPATTAMSKGATIKNISAKPYNKPAESPHSIESTKKRAKPTTQEPNKSQIEAIVEDFSMEKAVIYAEILEPKFKQY